MPFNKLFCRDKNKIGKKRRYISETDISPSLKHSKPPTAPFFKSGNSQKFNQSPAQMGFNFPVKGIQRGSSTCADRNTYYIPFFCKKMSTPKEADAFIHIEIA